MRTAWILGSIQGLSFEISFAAAFGLEGLFAANSVVVRIEAVWIAKAHGHGVRKAWAIHVDAKIARITSIAAGTDQ